MNGIFTRGGRAPHKRRCRREEALRRASRLIALALLYLVTTQAFGASLSEAYEAAMANDPVLGAARAQLAANEEAVPQTRALLLPNVGMSGSTAWNERKIINSGLPEERVQRAQLGGAAQPADPEHGKLVHPLQCPCRCKRGPATPSRAPSRRSSFAPCRPTSTCCGPTPWWNRPRRAEAATQRQLEQVQQRFDVGLVAITDVLEAQAGYDDSVVVRVQAVGDHDIFFEVLRTLTGEPYNEILDISEELPVINPAPGDVEEWVNTALGTNPNVLAAEEQLSSAERTVRARRSRPPADHRRYHLLHPVVTGGPQSFFGGKTESTVYGLTATLPIYQGGFTSSRTKEAQALADRSAQLLQDTRLTVGRDVRNLFRRVQTDVVRVGARLKAIASAESALEATETGYEVGTRNVVDVLRAQENFFRSQFDYADSRYNYMLSLILLKQQAGVLNQADVEELSRFTDPAAPVTRIASLKALSTN